MASPITAEDFDIPNYSGDLCGQIKKLLSVSAKLNEFFDWMFDEEGELSDEFMSLAASSNGVVSGSIIFMAVTSPPDGYLVCDGRTVSRSTYSALFAKIGTTYGAGDGSTTFTLPSIVNKFVLVSGTEYPTLGATGGEATHLLTIAEMPEHSHTISIYAGDGTNNAARINTTDETASLGTVTTGNKGGGTAHNNLPPYIVMSAFIKT